MNAAHMNAAQEILDSLMLDGPASNFNLAARTGLSKNTCRRVTNELRAAGKVTRTWMTICGVGEYIYTAVLETTLTPVVGGDVVNAE